MHDKSLNNSDPAAIVEIEEPEELKGELLKTVSGYLQITLDEMGFTHNDIDPIVQRFNEIVESIDKTKALNAYKKLNPELYPLEIMGIPVPCEYIDLKIADLKYSNDLMKVRILNMLTRKGFRAKNIVYIKDFYDNLDVAENLYRLRGFGKGCYEEFISALKRTIGG